MVFCMAAILCGEVRPESQNSAGSQLVNMRYFDHAGGSRLAIRVRGEFVYSMTKGEHAVRILLAGTGVAPSYDGARLRFSTGLVNTVCVDGAAGEGAVVAVRPRAGTAVRVVRMEGENGLYVDVCHDSSHVVGQDSFSLDAASAGMHHQVIVPIRTFSLNSLVFAESSGSAGEYADVTQTNDTVAAQVIPEVGTRRFAQVGLIPALLGLTSAILSTGLLLLLIRRHDGRKNVMLPPGVDAGFSEVLSQLSEWESRESGIQEKPQAPELPYSPPSHQDVSVLGLAKRYGRGLGEINLSFALKARQGERRWVQKVQEIAEGSHGADDNARIAKELGVGKGEVNLAIMLHHLKSPQTLRKELV